MSDGDCQIAYAIDSVIDIIALGVVLEPAMSPGLVAGVALVEGRPIEFIDPHWLFGEALSEARPAEGGAICLFADADDPWMRQVLRPLVEAAGYRVALAGEPAAARADIVIGGGATIEHGDGSVPVIRLRPRPEWDGREDDSVYRYDRIGLIEALRSRTAAGKAR
jgi:two-component system chemotaxis sensor kinase CheA